MIVGVPTEVKGDENRVGLRPVGAHLLTQAGHTVLIQRDAGIGSGLENQQYTEAGATLVDSAADVYSQADLIVKVKEPQPSEIALLRPNQTLFCYFHFAADHKLTEACLKAGINAVAYETLRDTSNRLPLLTPMSEVAGRMSIQEGAKYLEKPMMGRGILLGGVPGVEPANVLVLGAGIVGYNAARIASGLGANVTIMDINLERLRYLDDIMAENVTTIYSDPHAVDDYITQADLVVGSVLIPGARAPHLVTEKQVQRMRKGAVIVDVCIDQGGCVETSKPTTHQQPTYLVHDVVHYCVTNMPGAVGRTSTHALCNATLPYVQQLANLGTDKFLAQSPGHALALNLAKGSITHSAVAIAFPDLPADLPAAPSAK